MSLKLDEIIPWGRSRQEYELMFSLDQADLQKRIVGCGDGPASFNAEMTQAGFSVVSIDPIYSFSGEDIQKRFDASAETVMSQVRSSWNTWNWRYHRDPEGLFSNRAKALARFLADYETGKREGRYQVASLPSLPFAHGQFGLALCSHLLFLYSGQLSEAFHIQSVLELCRVAKEVRIFPLLDLAHRRSPYLEPVLDRLETEGFSGKVVRVNYEFQKGGNEMLHIERQEDFQHDA